MSDHPTLPRDPQELDHNGTFDDLLAELAMSDPLAPYAVVEPDAEESLNHQILAGLVLP